MQGVTERQYLRPNECAVLLGVSTQTLREYVRSGKVRLGMRTLGGHLRIPISEVERLTSGVEDLGVERIELLPDLPTDMGGFDECEDIVGGNVNTIPQLQNLFKLFQEGE